MSKFEPTEFVDDRYSKMSERLEVCRNQLLHTTLYYVPCRGHPFMAAITRLLRPLLTCIPLQVVRKRLDRPLTLAEKVCGSAEHCP